MYRRGTGQTINFRSRKPQSQTACNVNSPGISLTPVQSSALAFVRDTWVYKLRLDPVSGRRPIQKRRTRRFRPLMSRPIVSCHALNWVTGQHPRLEMLGAFYFCALTSPTSMQSCEEFPQLGRSLYIPFAFLPPKSNLVFCRLLIRNGWGVRL